MEKQKYYITTAIAYTSGKPHIGNTYEVVLADAIARYKRQQGYDVFFQTGTDEHGQKIELKAEEAGITPKEFVDNVSGEIKRIWDLMNTSYDKFIRTTDEDHEKQVKKNLQKNVRKRRHLQRTLRRNVLYTMRIFLYRISACRRQMSGLRPPMCTCKRRSILLQNEQIC